MYSVTPVVIGDIAERVFKSRTTVGIESMPTGNINSVYQDKMKNITTVNRDTNYDRSADMLTVRQKEKQGNEGQAVTNRQTVGKINFVQLIFCRLISPLNFRNALQ